MMNSGQIVFFNGTSSSGKTTIAEALQQGLSEPYMHVSVDGFFNLYPEKFLEPKNEEEVLMLVELVPRVVSGFHRCVSALAKAGNHLIVDHVLQEDEWLHECIKYWGGLDVLFVGVKCPLEIAEQREKERKDRDPGTARYQFNRVHSHGLYDVELDTSILSVEQSVAKVLESIHNKPEKPAFQILAAMF